MWCQSGFQDTQCYCTEKLCLEEQIKKQNSTLLSIIVLKVLPSSVPLLLSLLAFNLLSLFSMFNLLIIIYQVDFLFSSNLFCVLNASCIFMGISFFMLRNCSYMIFFKKNFLCLRAGNLLFLLFLLFLDLPFTYCPRSSSLFCVRNFFQI